MENITVAAAIVAIVKAVKEVYPALNGLLTVALAVLLGVGAGYLGLEGLNITAGVLVGLSAVGAVTVADRVSGQK